MRFHPNYQLVFLTIQYLSILAVIWARRIKNKTNSSHTIHLDPRLLSAWLREDRVNTNPLSFLQMPHQSYIYRAVDLYCTTQDPPTIMAYGSSYNMNRDVKKLSPIVYSTLKFKKKRIHMNSDLWHNKK